MESFVSSTHLINCAGITNAPRTNLFKSQKLRYQQPSTMTTTTAQTMKAIAIQRHGSEDVLEYMDLPKPVLTDPLDILVRVKAVALNPADYRVREGVLSADSNVTFPPVILGWDASGIVEEVGSAVTDIKVGDEVYYSGHAYGRQGCNAQYQLMDSRIVGKKPKSLTFEQAAAVPLVALTVWELLDDRMGITKEGESQGKSVLIIGGAGGLGSIGIQLCKSILGMVVIATSSREESKKWCRDMGADHVLDYKLDITEQLKEIGHPEVDYILMLASPDEYFEDSSKWIKPFSKIGLAVDSQKKLDLKGGSIVNSHLQKCTAFYWEYMFAR